MITTPRDYLNSLSLINNQSPPKIAILLPTDETIFEVNLDTRQVQCPKFISAKKDHNAETLYFVMDRYFDNMDLAQTVGMVQYINHNAAKANGTPNQGHVFIIPFYDITTYEDENKILFPWVVGGHATEMAGPITFSMRFFRMQEDGKALLFNLNTLPAKTEILDSLNIITPDNEDFAGLTTSPEFLSLVQRVQDLEQTWDIYWGELY